MTTPIVRLHVIRDDDQLIIGGQDLYTGDAIHSQACVAQAFLSALRGQPPPPGTVIELTDTQGQRIATAPPCRVSESSWTWKYHYHCHRPSPALESLGLDYQG